MRFKAALVSAIAPCYRAPPSLQRPTARRTIQTDPFACWYLTRQAAQWIHSAAFFAQGLTNVSGQQVVMDNRAGAGGVLGMEIGKNANPDGYTVLSASTAAMTIAPPIYRKLPYDPLKTTNSFRFSTSRSTCSREPVSAGEKR